MPSRETANMEQGTENRMRPGHKPQSHLFNDETLPALPSTPFSQTAPPGE